MVTDVICAYPARAVGLVVVAFIGQGLRYLVLVPKIFVGDVVQWIGLPQLGLGKVVPEFVLFLTGLVISLVLLLLQ